ncbi:NAD-dependent malic enzyme [Deinococcus soli (ex Cha et al. 2016)]|uniref:Malate dehydrogenase (Oxaloacetate-decarboxylating)/malate dehydrogenase (Oxaloacetate-decarboxylating)(NADP+) n=2 Tax=Deinococcus soli (ex Cha et al. 2016) TaxID=1309411 RepID=A0ACC6KHD8_9DEIO|nr:NAD-dependent malic enzyme [Deinococcus soli (ex Cha et al. 2016)]MDR6218889.1 malate dehydrogenase (oxaloacetate-decarboxylating)/malate dehydrogenase (oxaloacetate-decarboxylating)(NADP+) [Deinococcus soli (ex Cha et al. 2016)]MDR6328686.1 malate dehydrogenase (oxaloacetate-decarboxylating)/malate dehydrogenase (oxaloacetate-decarboxylating)(NADP+) [Deinococcus soli (ex Cha et al. 2016)]MDR6751827.1 malate dehydrogenase (oxaloacetate-decarboxylating)/malate dehydrogenase (oxaloacetate-decar
MTAVSRYYDVHRDAHGQRHLHVNLTGFALLRLPLLNKSTAFTHEERRALGLIGLLPPHVSTLDEQIERTWRRYVLQGNDLEKHIFLRNLQDRNEVLFYALVTRHLDDVLPILYTPTVGEAVRVFSHIYRYPRGLAISADTIGEIDQALDNVPLDDVRMIVATDSSAILGIGDQGFGGMAISIGKLSLYTAAGGVGPDKTLPVELDVGTNRQDLIDDPLYLGVRHERLTGAAYDDVLDRFVEGVAHRYPKAIIQWEDFASATAFRVLDRYRRVIPSFNDDIQGTGAMALAGVLSACRLTGERLKDQTFVVVGAGAGGTGVAWAITQGLLREGLSRDEARERVLVVDRQGLLTQDQQLDAHQVPYAQRPDRTRTWSAAGGVPTLLETVQQAGATVLLGLSGVPGLFTQPIIEAMLAHTARPVVFPLSNPTGNAEAVPADVLRWTAGQAIVATGSPFADVEYAGQVHPASQGNNAFIFPGLGFGAVLARAREITDSMVLDAAYTLSDCTDLSGGRVYPPVSALREVSLRVAARVMSRAVTDGVAAEYRLRTMSEADLQAYVRDRAWTPEYLPFQKAARVSMDLP